MGRPSIAVAAATLGREPRAGARLAGLALVEPFQQGEFDGLCGIYAIVNGLRLLVCSATIRVRASRQSR